MDELTPEKLARAACDDQEWKQIEMRAASECPATYFRAAINILNGEIAMLLPRTPDGDREQIQKGLGAGQTSTTPAVCNATTFKTFIAWDEVRSSTPAEQRPAFRFHRSNRVEQSEASENVELRRRTGTVFLWHSLQYGHAH